MAYRWNPEEYRKSSTEQQRWVSGLIAGLGLKGDESILDIGCGDGKITAQLAKMVPKGRVIGIDSSPEMVEYARRTFPSSDHPNIDFLVMDALSLDFASEFDLVTSFACLHWVKDHQTVLREIQKSLRRGGRLLIQCGGKGNVASAIEVASMMITSDRWSRYFQGFEFPYHFYDSVGYRHWLDQAGLRPKRVELVEKELVHPTKESLEGWIRSTWMPYTDRVPKEERSVFTAELADRYIETHPPLNGAIRIKAVRLEVEAEKQEPDGAIEQ